MNVKLKRSKMLGALLIVLFTAALVQNEGHRKNDILLMDIEALAAGEGNIAIRCIGIGSLDCPVSNQRVYRIIEPLSQY